MSVHLELAWSSAVPQPVDPPALQAGSHPVRAGLQRVVGAWPTCFCLDRGTGQVVWTRALPEVNSVLGLVEPDVVVATRDRHCDMGWDHKATYGLSLASGDLLWKVPRSSAVWLDGDRVGCSRTGRILCARTGKRIGKWNREPRWPAVWRQLRRSGVPIGDGLRVHQDDSLDILCRAADGRVLWRFRLAAVLGLNSSDFCPPYFWGIAWRTAADGTGSSFLANLQGGTHDAAPVVVVVDTSSHASITRLELPCRGLWQPYLTSLSLNADSHGAVVSVFDRVFAVRATSAEAERPS